jgi:hypothetical protein
MFGRKRAESTSVVGKWMGRVNGEPAALEFRTDGRLAYVVQSADGKTQIMRMAYRVEGDTIVTNQPSAPREERSSFRIDGDSLTIDFAGTSSQFTRQS